MFRRIELISHFERPLPDTHLRDLKHGLMGVAPMEVIDAWIEHLRGPNRSIPRNARFYFTELGWAEVGRQVVEACGRTGQEYRVIAVKENSVDVVWRDKHTGYEVAAQPKRSR